MAEEAPRITVTPNGPYHVRGGVRLVRKAPVVSEHGEPLTWQTGAPVPAGDTFALCRCGRSANKPFCDGSHARTGFDGTETAPTAPSSERQRGLRGKGIHVRDDESLCVHAGFCGNRVTNVWKMVRDTGDTQVRAQLMAMVERCPSGRLTYALEPDGPAIEPDLPVEIGLIEDGPLWVVGGIPVTRADGQELEARNRVTLCRCGASKNKPLCDGSHAAVGFRDRGPIDAVPAGVDVGAAGAPPTDSGIAADAPPGADSGTAADAGRYLRYMAEFIGFTADEAAAVRRTKPALERHLPRIMTDFYAQLLRYPPTRALFLGPDGGVDQDYVELRMRHQVNFWLRTADAVLDDDYGRYVDFVGRAHTARGADPSIYVAERYVIGMVGFVQHAISKALMAELDDGPDADLALEAWDKLNMVILEVLARAYGHERSAETFAPLVPVDEAAVARLAARAYALEAEGAAPGATRAVPVAAAADVPEGERRLLTVDGLSIGVFHLAGAWYAIRNLCLHRAGPVATGALVGTHVQCPWHGYTYDVTTGRCLADPSAQLDTYAVTVEDGQVYVHVPVAT